MPRTSHPLEVAGREVSVSNLDKLMFPTGFTKGQTIEQPMLWRMSSHGLTVDTQNYGNLLIGHPGEVPKLYNSSRAGVARREPFKRLVQRTVVRRTSF